MEKHELVDQNGNKTGKILTNEEIKDIKNVPEGHYVSVVGVVIINENNEVLLQKRSKYKKINPSKWGICGGKVNLGENLVDACVRETLEEIGIQLRKDELKLLSNSISGKGYFTIYYTRRNVDIKKCKIQEKELDEVKYFKIDELENLDHEGFEWLESLFIKIHKNTL